MWEADKVGISEVYTDLEKKIPAAQYNFFEGTHTA